MWKGRSAYRDLVEKYERRKPPKDPGLDGRIILKWIFERLDVGMDCIDLAQDRNM
jgi:hypothetical protein